MVSNSIIHFILTTLYGKGHFDPATNHDSITHQFLIIPGREGPKWVIPLQPKFGLTVLKQWRPYSHKARIKWIVILLAYQWGVLKYLPTIKQITFISTQHIGYSGTQLSLDKETPIM